MLKIQHKGAGRGDDAASCDLAGEHTLKLIGALEGLILAVRPTKPADAVAQLVMVHHKVTTAIDDSDDKSLKTFSNMMRDALDALGLLGRSSGVDFLDLRHNYLCASEVAIAAGKVAK